MINENFILQQLKLNSQNQENSISFSQAHAQTLFLTGNINAGKTDANKIKLYAALEIISLVLAEIHQCLSALNIQLPPGLTELLTSYSIANLNIARRMADSRFYVGLLGEFSCGKSAFINALLEEEVLYSNVLQGTTCVKTILAFGEEENCTAFFKNGRNINFLQEMAQIKDDASPQSDTMRDFIWLMTASEKYAADISEVVCAMPNPILSSGMALVDTPGIGSTYFQHEEICKKSLSDCDAILVLSSVDKPLSAELLAMVKKIAGKDATGCIFIATKKDMLPLKEVSRLKKFFQKKLEMTFGKKCQFEFVSAYKVLTELKNPEQNSGELTAFRKFRHDLFDFLSHRRKSIQAQKINLLIQTVITQLDREFKKYQENFTNFSRGYENDLIQPESAKWCQWQDEIEAKFSLARKKIKRELPVKTGTLVKNIREVIHSEIESCKDEEELQWYLTTGIRLTFEKWNQKISRDILNFISKALEEKYKIYTEEYKKRFKKEYAKLENIIESYHFNQAPAFKTPILQLNKMISLESSESYAQEISADANLKIAGGLATGIGLTFLIPGAGWIAGSILAVIGSVAGKLINASFLKPLTARQEEAIEKLDLPLNELEKNLSVQIENTFSELAAKYAKAFNANLEQQRQEYSNFRDAYNYFLNSQSQKIQNANQLISQKIQQLHLIGKEIEKDTQAINNPEKGA